MNSCVETFNDLKELVTRYSNFDYGDSDTYKKQAFEYLMNITNELCESVDKKNANKVHFHWSKFNRFLSDSTPTIDSFFEEYYKIERRLRVIGFLNQSNQLKNGWQDILDD